MTAQYPVRLEFPNSDKASAYESMSVHWHASTGASGIERWAYVGQDQKRRDSANLAASAATKWRLANRFGLPASSLDQMNAAIAENAQVEVTAMLVARGKGWWRGVVGFAQFHRTWNNNIYLDYLAAHPDAKGGSVEVFGVGAWLILEVCNVAHALGARLIWGETTDQSADYYQHLLSCPKFDLLLITAGRRDKFRQRQYQWLKAVQQLGAKP